MNAASPRKKHSLRILCLSIILSMAVIILLFCLWLRKQYVPVSYESFSYKETSDILSNPWQGFYQLCGYCLSDDNDNLEASIASHIAASREDALALVQINLKNYNSGPLSEEALKQLTTILASWSRTDTRLILRFLYDWDGKGLENEPKTIEQIQEHMTQVAPIVNQYADYIYILQGIFVGNCGEMNNSAFLSREDMTQLMTHFAGLTDPDIFLSVRTPSHWRIITDTVDLPDPFPAFDGSLTARLGLYNDGMLGSLNDTGTYGDTSRSISDDPGAKRPREEELSFQETLCRYVPNGGEVILENPCNDLPNAIADLSQIHVSYLNRYHDLAVLDKWKASTYTGDGCFHGCSGYDYISAHLGYRYVLSSSSLQFNTWTDEKAALSFTLENKGFASCLKPLELRVTLHGLTTDETHSYPLSEDLRFLQSGSAMSCSLNLPVRDLAPETYALYLNIKDVTTGQTILLGSNGQTKYGYSIGQLSIGKDSQETAGSLQSDLQTE